MSARAPAQPYQLSFPPSHRGSVISNLNPPAAPLSPLTLDVGGIGLIRRNTPTRAARARQNWQRLAQKAYRTGIGSSLKKVMVGSERLGVKVGFK